MSGLVPQREAPSPHKAPATLNSGDVVTFVLEGNVTNPKVANTNSTLQASLQNFSDMSKTTFGPGTTASHLAWVDEDSAIRGYFYWIEFTDTVVNSTTYSG